MLHVCKISASAFWWLSLTDFKTFNFKMYNIWKENKREKNPKPNFRCFPFEQSTCFSFRESFRNEFLWGCVFVLVSVTLGVWSNMSSTESSSFNSRLLGSSQRICLQCRRPSFNPWVGKIPLRRKQQPTPVFLPGESHGQRSPTGYSPWDHKSQTRLSN